MPKLIMCKGLPASGKTTWAKEEVLKHPVNSYKRVSKDDLRSMIDCGRWSKGAEKIILSVRDRIIEESLAAGHNVIVDDTNLDPKHEAALREIADDMFCEFEVIKFDVELEECVRRNEVRNNGTPEEAIRDMYHRYIYRKGL